MPEGYGTFDRTFHDAGTAIPALARPDDVRRLVTGHQDIDLTGLDAAVAADALAFVKMDTDSRGRDLMICEVFHHFTSWLL